MQTAIGMVLLAVYHPFLLAFDVLLVSAMVFIVAVLGRGAVTTAISESKAKYALEAWLEQIAGAPAHLQVGRRAGLRDASARGGCSRTTSTYRAKHFRILIRQVVGSFALQAIASSALLGIGGFLVIDRQLTLGQLGRQRDSSSRWHDERLHQVRQAARGLLRPVRGHRQAGRPGRPPARAQLAARPTLPGRRSGGRRPARRRCPLRGRHRGRARVSGAGRSPPAIAWASPAPTAPARARWPTVLFGLRTPTAGAVRDRRRRRDATCRSPSLRTAVGAGPRGRALPRLGHRQRPPRPRPRREPRRRHPALTAVGLLDELLSAAARVSTRFSTRHGRPLSHRQACRLMIARAIVVRPRLLVHRRRARPASTEPDERARSRRDPVRRAARRGRSSASPNDRTCWRSCSRVVSLRGGEMPRGGCVMIPPHRVANGPAARTARRPGAAVGPRPGPAARRPALRQRHRRWCVTPWQQTIPGSRARHRPTAPTSARSRSQALVDGRVVRLACGGGHPASAPATRSST